MDNWENIAAVTVAALIAALLVAQMLAVVTGKTRNEHH